MKKRSLFFMLFCVSVFAFGQSKISSVEYSQKNPVAQKVNFDKTGEVIGNSDKMLNPDFTYTYLGFFDGLDGPSWSTNPPCYTGQEAAALLFGSNPDDYVISTNPNTTDPNTITFTAWLGGYAVPGWTEFPQDYKVDVPPTGYANPGGYASAYSAYVWDNPPPPGSSINYVWQVAAPPTVPISNWPIIIGFLLVGGLILLKYRKKMA